MEVSGQSHAPADLLPPPPGETAPRGTHSVGGCVGPISDLDFCIREKSLAAAGVRILDNTALSLGVLLTELHRLPSPRMIL